MTKFFDTDTVNKLKVDLLIAVIYAPVYMPIFYASKYNSKVTPNVVTLLGVFCFLSSMLISYYYNNKVFLAIGLYLFSGADIADGFVARKLNKSSRIGAILDLVSDRLVFILLFFSLLYLSDISHISTSEIIIYSLYTVLFLYFDSLKFTVIQASTLIEEIKYHKHNNININECDVSMIQFILRADFRFSSYVPVILWLGGGGKVFLYMAIACVLIEYFRLFLSTSISLFRLVGKLK
ncbi:CDP-alcohol phosphatidyltransferase family protein [Vibrio breoganii]